MIGSTPILDRRLPIIPWSLRRGLATNAAVRSERHLEGLLPARRGGLQLEVDRALAALKRCTTPLQKYEVRSRRPAAQ